MSAEDDNNLKLKRVERIPGLGIFELDVSWRDRVKDNAQCHNLPNVYYSLGNIYTLVLVMAVKLYQEHSISRRQECVVLKL